MPVDMLVKANRVEAIRLSGFLRELSATGRHVFDDGERERLRSASGFLARLADRPDLDPSGHGTCPACGGPRHGTDECPRIPEGEGAGGD